MPPVNARHPHLQAESIRVDAWHLDNGDDVAALLKGVDWRERTLRTPTASCAFSRAFAINRFDAGQCDCAVPASSWTDVERAGNVHMLKAREIPHKTGAQFAVAVFDNWDALHATLIGLEAETPVRTGGVLHARTDVPVQATGLRFMRQMTNINFAHSRQELACTTGRLADELAARLAQGARSLGDALEGSLNSDHARQLESHIDRGHLVLWVELHSSDEFSEVCGRLVQASPHMVSLCGINASRNGASA